MWFFKCFKNVFTKVKKTFHLSFFKPYGNVKCSLKNNVFAQTFWERYSTLNEHSINERLFITLRELLRTFSVSWTLASSSNFIKKLNLYHLTLPGIMQKQPKWQQPQQLKNVSVWEAMTFYYSHLVSFLCSLIFCIG